MEGRPRMKGGRSLLSLTGSLVLHGLAVFVAFLLVSRGAPPPVVIVELGEAIRVSEMASGPAPPARARRSSLRSASAPAAQPLPARPPVSQPEPSPGPPAPEQPESPLPAPPRAVVERTAEVGPAPSTSQRTGTGKGSVQESVGSGIPGGGPLAMVAPPAAGAGGEVAAALPGGGEGGVPIEFGPYLARFRQRIQESLTYPLAARRRGLGGTVQLEIELLPTGQVASVVIRTPSAHAILDEAAFDTVRRLPPVPFPPGAPSRALRVRLPVVFELR